MQLERKAKNGWVLEQHDLWFNFYLSHEIMKDQNKAGTLRITTLGDAVLEMSKKGIDVEQ